jgi:hypothetical protein
MDFSRLCSYRSESYKLGNNGILCSVLADAPGLLFWHTTVLTLYKASFIMFIVLLIRGTNVTQLFTEIYFALGTLNVAFYKL